MDWFIWVVVALGSIWCIGIMIAVVVFYYKKNSSFRPDSIRTGMTEAEVISRMGTPENTIVIDKSTKVFTYSKNEPYLLVMAKRKEVHISLKYGIVINISESSHF